MKSHVLRPLWVVLGLIALVLIARYFYVPKDFGVHERGYMYGWFRAANIEDWKKVTVKYQGSDYCKTCHPEKNESISRTPHALIECENCHGPGLGHPSDLPKLTIDKSRGLCLRCHTSLPYPTSGRANIRGIDPDKHNPDLECVMCHHPHKSAPEGLK